MGIGNEQWETEKVNFFERYTIFEKAIHSRYPDMKLIGSAGPDVRTPRYEAAWSFYRENRDKKNFAYAIDEHYYMPPEWFLENTHFYDDYDRAVKVFSGEYAAHPKRPGSEKSGNTLQGAVSEAAFLTGVERNSDVVVMSSYAPLFAREGYVQWAPDMIWFDDEKAYGTPSYHVQKMYSNNMGSWDLEADTDFDPDSEAVFFNASYDAKRDEVILKLVNASDEDKAIDLDLADYLDVRNTEAFVLSGDAPGAFNSLECPDRVEMKKVAVNPGEKHVFPKMSFTVIRFGF
jgi:alpha-L-arabinofuranosidase